MLCAKADLVLERMKYVTKKNKVMRTTTTQRTIADYGPELKLCGAQLEPSMQKKNQSSRHQFMITASKVLEKNVLNKNIVVYNKKILLSPNLVLRH